jgi:cytochrome c oxidase assembly factor CtaG
VDPAVAAALRSWSFDPWVVAGLLAAGGVYGRGFLSLRERMPERFPAWRAAAFLGGLGVLLLAIASPLDAFGALLLQVHMLQHLLLMLVAPPLVWLSAPLVPLLSGLPRGFRRRALGPFLAWPALRRLARFAVHPVVAWMAFAVATWAWHVPRAYQLALRSPFWHELEHLCFFGSGLLFWFPVVQPWPSRPVWPRPALIPYLALAALQNTIFSAIFAFSDRLLYPAYAQVPRLGGISALDDQAAAGAVMWIPGSAVMLAALAGLLIHWREPVGTPPRARAPSRSRRRRRALDLLAVRGLGPLLRARAFRRSLRLGAFALAAAVVLDGLLGPQMSPMNLAGVIPWTYWRAFVVLGLLVAGNLFCMACPFTATRGLARRLGFARFDWPVRLRTKWIAVALFALYLGAYEVFDLWDSPYWTAWIAIGYFAASFGLDALFRAAPFCRYVCPIGQYQFVSSVLSPLEVRVRDAGVCAQCTTRECIRGSAASPGCEMDLFQPAKSGNLDCTFCLDCVRACPHENVGLRAAAPGANLLDDGPRAGLGRLTRRFDVVALALVLVFGAFANAAGMVAPVARFEGDLAAGLGLASRVPVTVALLLTALLIAPALAALALGWASARLGGLRRGRSELACALALALVPLGFAMWLAHFSFHLWAGAGTVVPVVQRAALDLGSAALGRPDWTVSSAGAGSAALPFELAALGVGLWLTLLLLWRSALGRVARPARALAAAAPWGVLAVVLYGAGVWILLQPMEMRGMVM